MKIVLYVDISVLYAFAVHNIPISKVEIPDKLNSHIRGVQIKDQKGTNQSACQLHSEQQSNSEPGVMRKCRAG